MTSSVLAKVLFADNATLLQTKHHARLQKLGARTASKAIWMVHGSVTQTNSVAHIDPALGALHRAVALAGAEEFAAAGKARLVLHRVLAVGTAQTRGVCDNVADTKYCLVVYVLVALIAIHGFDNDMNTVVVSGMTFQLESKMKTDEYDR